MKLCECGCGKPAPIAKRNCPGKGMVKGEPCRFIHGHNGVKHGMTRRRCDHREYQQEWARKKRARVKEAMTTEGRIAVETRKVASRFAKGMTPWNKGKKTGQIPWSKGMTKETDERLALLSTKVSESVKELWKNPNYKGGNKLGVSFNLTDEQRKRYSERFRGEKNPMYGMSREKSPVWRGGVTFIPYPFEYGVRWRKEIKERDFNTCQVCGVCRPRGVHVHHIDYNKENCDPLNMITLCPPCHGKTKKGREYWKEHLTTLNERRLAP